MTKLGTSMLAAALAVVGLASAANAARFESKGSYSVYQAAPATVLTQSAVFSSGSCAQPATVLTQPAVLAPATCAPATCAPATVITQPAVVAPACGAQAACPTGMIIQQTLMHQALLPGSGFSLDPAARCLYTGPRFENTLTMPDANTYLRP